MKTVIITGGASGLGLAAAELLAEKGFNVVIFDINRENLRKIESVYSTFTVDVTDEENVVSAVATVVEKFKTVDVLVNCAGTIFSEPVLNLLRKGRIRHGYDTFRKHIDLNLNSVFLVSSVVAEQMAVARTDGVIVNISSVCASGNSGQSAYSAAKAGVEVLTRVFARELGCFGIRFVAVAPGFIETQSTRCALDREYIEKLESEIPLRRLGDAGDVAHSILFAIENRYITGSVLRVDGGMVV